MRNVNRYRVAVIEPSSLIQAGLKALIEEGEEAEVVSQMYDMNHYEQKLAVARCDLIILNPVLVEFNKRGNIRGLFRSFESVPLIAFVLEYTDPEVISQFDGTLSAFSDKSRIRSMFREVFNAGKRGREAHPNDELTHREREVLIAVAKGMMNKEIADLYNISVHTVMSHRKNIISKTGIKSVSGLTVYALLNNLIDENDVQ